jgi:DNA-directed RNA polymerase subunit RPC12/RpoP
MQADQTTPIVRVVFVCAGCSEPFEATQIHRPAVGTFTCGFCGEKVYSWSDSHDYTDWRSVRRPPKRKAWLWETRQLLLAI